MLNSIMERREKETEGLYKLTLEIAEKDFFEVYENVDDRAANDLIMQYLVSSEDDARPKNIGIRHNKNRHTIKLTSELHYLENDHTDYSN